MAVSAGPGKRRPSSGVEDRASNIAQPSRARSGLNVSQITRAESGRDIQLSTLFKIAAGLGYQMEFTFQEMCEEAGELLERESWRREERRDAGLIMGKRWR